MPTSMSHTTIACARYLAFRLPNYVLLCAEQSTTNPAILSLQKGKSNGLVWAGLLAILNQGDDGNQVKRENQ